MNTIGPKQRNHKTHPRTVAKPNLMRRAAARAGRILQPQAVIPAVLGFGLLGFVVVLGRPSVTGPLIARVGPGTVALVFCLTVLYLAARAAVWHQLLQQSGARLGWRPTLAAFAGGEFAKSVPGGILFENYLLRRSSDVPVGQSVAATVAVSGVEAVLAIPLVLICGVPGWSWLRPTLGSVLLLYLLGLGVLFWLLNPWGETFRVRLPRRLTSIVSAVRAGAEYARPLLSPRTVWENALPTAASLAATTIALLVVGRSIGLEQLDLRAAVVVVSFTVLALVLLPIPTDVGLTEASGAGALMAFGATPSQAVATFLALRVLTVGSTMLVAGATMLALWQRTALPQLFHDGAGPLAEDRP
jgi:uncharacterized membrane protein YbhN (UPF0104 family)